MLVVVGPLIGTPPGSPTPVPGVPGTLQVGSGQFPLSSQVLGVNVHVVGVQNSSLAALVNATPFTSFRFSPLGEATDQVHSMDYSLDGHPSPVYGETDPEFVTWCRWVGCRATMMVPAEIDNTTEAVATVRYVEQNLSFHPEYWAIGNEPQQWTHFGIPWTRWQANDSSTATPSEYAVEVQQYVQAMRSVDPTIRIIGIESVVGGTTANAWIRDLVQLDGPNLTAIAYHAYPLGNGTSTATPASFYAGLTNPSSFPLNYPTTEAIVRAACPACTISIFVDEFNSALGGNYSSYMVSYSEVPFVSAALALSMEENVNRVLFFDLEDLNAPQPYGLTTVGGGLRPAYFLYADILDHLALGSVVNSSVQGGPSGLYEVMTTNGTSTSVFLVNTNLTAGLELTLPDALFFSQPTTEYSWAYPQAMPSAPSSGTVPSGSGIEVPAQSVVLLDWGQSFP